MIKLEYYLIDVFTDTQFGGNPLAVFYTVDPRVNTEMMQKIANELNLSETTFIRPPQKKGNDFQVRIFTPAEEMPTAGHPTIGTAFVILNVLKIKPEGQDYLIFEEQVGDIRIEFSKRNEIYTNITMHQPLPDFGIVVSEREAVAEILSLDIGDLDDNLPVQSVSCGNRFIFVPVKQMSTLEKIKFRLDLIEKYNQYLDTNEFYVFSRETNDPAFDTHGRMFAPMLGVFEDPATGSATGPLGCYLVRHGITDGADIKCEQGFEMGRPSRLFVRVEQNNGQISSVKVSGNCCFVGGGKILIRQD
jgi:trans-2,3-dihydro-3-hydroxyanthranilate isomerase